MSSDVEPEQRTAAEVLAAHASATHEARRRRRRLAGQLGTVLAVIVAYELSCYPRTQAVWVSPQRVVDVVAVTRDAGVQRMFGARGDGLGPAFVVQYFSAARGSQAQGLERIDVFDWARPQAEGQGLHAIVLWRIEPVVTRLLPFQRGDFYAFRQRPDGTWGGL
jgi:hypothetical protein